uniref:Putative ADP ribosylation factor 3 n=1 Tax=Trypanosoma congolense (strain IL3000) TaxID=1068625 RepID=G0UX45_TRYCI|nr:putative ADP ribosylation factor 3 [Trypanosoma congolense IL3000]
MGLLDFFLNIRSLSRRTRRVLMLGLDNAGKTCVLRRMCEEEVTDTFPTQGFNIKLLKTENIKINVWDIGGQRSVRYYWRHYFDHTDVLLFVVDSADMERIEEASMEFQHILQEDKLSGVPVLVLANKQDIPGALSADGVASALRLHDVTNRRWHVEPCSAIAGESLSSGLSWILDTLRLRRRSSQ